MRNFPYHSSNIETLIADNFNSLIFNDLNAGQSNVSPLTNSSLATSSRSYFNNIPFPASRTVYYDQFLDINCCYLNPDDLSDSLLNVNSNDLVVYHNNIRSLKKNFSKVQDELFYNCSNYPDILAFTETRISKDTSNIPSLEGYSFEHVDAPHAIGGVGVYLSNSISYTVINNLHIDSTGCENIWIQIDLKNNKNAKHNNSIIIGVVYRHPGSKYEGFCEKLCNQLLILNQKKTKYIIVGDFNFDLIYNVFRPNYLYVFFDLIPSVSRP